ncbi:hypothetical protein TNCV_1781801 [Trichonephila clavipes]|nr:hypothetical protein TNCV_1781801 [Trichonephila clavipes]
MSMPYEPEGMAGGKVLRRIQLDLYLLLDTDSLTNSKDYNETPYRLSIPVIIPTGRTGIKNRPVLSLLCCKLDRRILLEDRLVHTSIGKRKVLIEEHLFCPDECRLGAKTTSISRAPPTDELPTIDQEFLPEREFGQKNGKGAEFLTKKYLANDADCGSTLALRSLFRKGGSGVAEFLPCRGFQSTRRLIVLVEELKELRYTNNTDIGMILIPEREYLSDCARFRLWPRKPLGQGIRSWLASHEFEPSTTKDPPYREAMHVKSVKSSNVLPMGCGSLESGCRHRHLTMVQKDEVRRQRPSCIA